MDVSETPPRLTPDGLDILERQFQQTRKPTSDVEEDLASQLSVDIAIINNWFQNRRAREKHALRSTWMQNMGTKGQPYVQYPDIVASSSSAPAGNLTSPTTDQSFNPVQESEPLHGLSPVLEGINGIDDFGGASLQLDRDDQLSQDFIEDGSQDGNSSPLAPTFHTMAVERFNFEDLRHHRALKDFGQQLQKAAEAVLVTNRSSRYTTVSVLMMYWQDGGNLPISQNVRELAQVFTQEYGFVVDIWPIPNFKSHQEVNKKVTQFVEDDDPLHLRIFYYAGHAHLSPQGKMIWTGATKTRQNLHPPQPQARWSDIQSMLEEASVDVLILLDCCKAGLSNCDGGNGVTSLIAACSFNVTTSDIGTYSFTPVLIRQLKTLRNLPSFSAAYLYSRIYLEIQNRPKDSGAYKEPPVHLILSQDPDYPRDILLSGRHNRDRFRKYYRASESESEDEKCASRSSSPDNGPSSSRDNSLRELSPDTSLTSTSPTLQYPKLLLSLRLLDDIDPSALKVDLFAHWLSAVPIPVDAVKIEAVFASDSTIVLVSIPVGLLQFLPTDPSLSLLGTIRSPNQLLTLSENIAGSLETQVKDKNLLIGKLRHEAVILNDHLAKALRLHKKVLSGHLSQNDLDDDNRAKSVPSAMLKQLEEMKTQITSLKVNDDGFWKTDTEFGDDLVCVMREVVAQAKRVLRRPVFNHPSRPQLWFSWFHALDATQIWFNDFIHQLRKLKVNQTLTRSLVLGEQHDTSLIMSDSGRPQQDDSWTWNTKSRQSERSDEPKAAQSPPPIGNTKSLSSESAQMDSPAQTSTETASHNIAPVLARDGKPRTQNDLDESWNSLQQTAEEHPSLEKELDLTKSTEQILRGFDHSEADSSDALDPDSKESMSSPLEKLSRSIQKWRVDNPSDNSVQLKSRMKGGYRDDSSGISYIGSKLNIARFSAKPGPRPLPCELVLYSNCTRIFKLDEVDEWITHVARDHLNYNYPSTCFCWFCDSNVLGFGSTWVTGLSKPFESRMKHIANHLRVGDRSLLEIRPDFFFLNHMLDIGGISEMSYQSAKTYFDSVSLSDASPRGWRPPVSTFTGDLASSKPSSTTSISKGVQTTGSAEMIKMPTRSNSQYSGKSWDLKDASLDDSGCETPEDDSGSSDDESVNVDGTQSNKTKKGPQRFYCTDYPPCNLSFTRPEQLARHIGQHTGDKPFQCHCSQRFSRIIDLRQHAEAVHTNEDIPMESLASRIPRQKRHIRVKETVGGVVQSEPRNNQEQP